MIDTKKYKALLNVQKAKEQEKLFAQYDATAEKKRLNTVGSIYSMFPLFADVFVYELLKAKAVWLFSEDPQDDSMGSPGVLLDELIFAPHAKEGEVLVINVGIYAGCSPAKEIGSIPEGDESLLANYIDELNGLLKTQSQMSITFADGVVLCS